MFFAGLVKDEERIVITGYASPTIHDLCCVITGPANVVDWGPLASAEASERLAALLLQSVLPSCGNMVPATSVIQRYAREVVRTMGSGRMWLLSKAEIVNWVDTKVMVQ